MKWTDGIRIAIASLFENRLRSFLTLLGIAISVTAVILVISVIEGLNLYVADAIGDLGPDQFALAKFGIIKNEKEWFKAARRNKDLEISDARAIERQAKAILRIGVSRRWGASVKFGSKTISDVGIQAVTSEVREMMALEVAQGRDMTPGEIERAAPICFLGHEVADQLFAPLEPLERKIRIWGRSFRVVGVAEKKGSVFGASRDNFVMIPITLYEKMRGSRGSVGINIQAVDAKRLQEAIDETRVIMRARHHLSYNDEDDFGIITSAGVMQVWDNLTKMIFRVAIFVVSISLVVGGIVIMNIMLLTVVERTREIGVRKAIGARQRDIQFQFLVEAVFLCATGGLLGVAVGWVFAWIARTFTPLPAQFPLWAPFLAVAVTSAVGVFFGLQPARQAARLDPIEALRSQST